MIDTLPDEIIGLILAKLKPEDAASVQLVSRRYLSLGRDSELWKHACFEHSRAEARRRRQELLRVQEATLAALTQAVSGLPPHSALAGLRNYSHSIDDVDAQTAASEVKSAVRSRTYVNWDPSRPGERIDYYQEYIHRYGPISVDWLQPVYDGKSELALEAVGVGTLESGEGVVEKVVAPLDDGSVALWQLSGSEDESSLGRVIDRSAPVLATAGQASIDSNNPVAAITNETGAIDNVSVDSSRRRAYFAVQDTLSEVDLNTLQVVRRESYPFPITSLSAVQPSIPLTVGTAMTLHLYDTRDHRPSPSESSVLSRTELISGPAPISSSHALLSESGPLSILHDDNDVWVAGRFKSLLCYDRRAWPRVNRTIFSGARLSSLCRLPFAHLPHDLDLHRDPTLSVRDYTLAKNVPGATLVAAGEYRGKGSLELYGLSNPSHTTAYHNRQTASRSRLLSVAPHGARLAFSDGDGGIKWTERDGATLVRAFNINDVAAKPAPSSTPDSDADSGYWSSGRGAPEHSAAQPALFAVGENSSGDIVQKLTPTRGSSAAGAHGRTTNADDLLIWTGDGRLGLLGFRRSSAFSYDGAGEGGPSGDAGERQRMYEMRMRRALERQADETRFVRGLGLAMGME